jgi:ASCH domain
LSVRPEWAWAVLFADPPKNVEVRTWRSRYRGEIGIHASLRPDPEARPFMAQLGIEVPAVLPRGMILGTVDLRDCVRDAASPWADPGDFWYWLLADRKPWPVPVRAKGDLGLWEWCG